jgi:hypothetical protein
LMGGVAGGVFSGVSGMLSGGTFMGGVQGGLPSGMFGNPQAPFLNQNIFGGQVAPTVSGPVGAAGAGTGNFNPAQASPAAAQAGGGFFDSVGNYITTNPKTSLALAGGAGLLLGSAMTPTAKATSFKDPFPKMTPEQIASMSYRGPTSSTPYTGDVRVPTYSPNPIYAARGGPIEVDARVGGHLKGPGTGTSDSIPAKLSDGEFVMTARAVKGAGGGSRAAGAKRMYDMMHQFEKRA